MEAEGTINGTLPSAFYLAIHLIDERENLKKSSISDNETQEFKRTYIEYLDGLHFDDFAHWTTDEYKYMQSLGPSLDHEHHRRTAH